jgi:colicin import membrane protein
LTNAKAAYDKATEDLVGAVTRADALNASIEEKGAQVRFMQAEEIDTTTDAGRKRSDKLERLAKELAKLTTKASSANEFVSKVRQVQSNAEAALATAQESIANKGKTQAELYAEAQAKQEAAAAAAIARKEEAERQQNLQKAMEAAALAKKEADARAKKEATEKAALAAARKAAE